MTPAGVETVLHSFKGGNDGSLPAGHLIKAGGMLYGTTAGGNSVGICSGGWGTVFSVAP